MLLVVIVTGLFCELAKLVLLGTAVVILEEEDADEEDDVDEERRGRCG